MKTQHFRFVSLVLLAVLCLTACDGGATETEPPPTAAVQTTLKLSGMPPAHAVLKALKPAFEADTPGCRLELLPAAPDPEASVKGVMQGLLDVAALARPITEEETAQGIEFVKFGTAGAAIVTHPDTGVTNLTTEQVRAIFAGEITNWSQVGGPDEQILLYVLPEKKPGTKKLRAAVFGDTPFPEQALMLTDPSELVTLVEGTRGGVGYVIWPVALATGADVQPVVLDGVAPDESAYPVTTPFGIAYLADRQADVQPLIDWLLSEKGEAALREFGVITGQ